MILGSSVAFLIFLITGTLFVESKSNAVYSQFIAPIEKQMEKMIAEEEKRQQEEALKLPANSYSEVNVEINNNSAESTTSVTTYPQPTQAVQYVPPVYTYPTATQQQIQQSEEFQRQWDERQQYINEQNAAVQQSQAESQQRMQEMDASYQEMKQRVEESQRKFCEENPDLCD